MRPDIDAIRARASAARPGPWGWFGNTKFRNVYLATKHSGRIYVMAFERWGMQGARPWFQEGEGETKMVGMPVVYDVCPEATSDADRRLYRHDFSAIRMPDAEFIAHSRQDVDDLLAYIDELEAGRPFDERTCRECGCTDDFACEGGCSWVEWDLCSACVSVAKGGAE